METSTIKKGIFVALFLIALVVWGRNLTLFFPSTSTPDVVKVTRKPTQSQNINESTPGLISSSFVYQPTFRDPFEPSFIAEEKKAKEIAKKQKVEKLEPPPAYVLNGIVWDKKFPYAIINSPQGESFVAKKGDVIGEIKISQITPKELWFVFKGKKYKLNLPE